MRRSEAAGHLRPVNPDVGDRSARRDDLLAELDGGRDSDGFDRRVDAALTGHLHDGDVRFAIGAVDGSGGAEALRLLETVVIEIDHDDLGR